MDSSLIVCVLFLSYAMKTSKLNEKRFCLIKFQFSLKKYNQHLLPSYD